MVYAKHLQFNVPYQVYDTSLIPIQGMVTIGDTGCPVRGAQVCVVDAISGGTSSKVSVRTVGSDGKSGKQPSPSPVTTRTLSPTLTPTSSPFSIARNATNITDGCVYTDEYGNYEVAGKVLVLYV